MSTSVVRVPKDVHQEAARVAALRGQQPGNLLAEAWREGSVEYATVAMRFRLVDRTIERASGRVVDGSEVPQEVTELWTFMRSGHGNWLLSAIQQT